MTGPEKFTFGALFAASFSVIMFSFCKIVYFLANGNYDVLWPFVLIFCGLVFNYIGKMKGWPLR